MNSLGLIVLLPLLGSALAYLIGRRVRVLAGWVATAAAASSFAVVYQTFSALPSEGEFNYKILEWIQTGHLKIDLLLTFDALTAVMCLVITGVGSLIHLYSIGYMAEDEHSPRFFAYLNLFMFSMLMLVLGGNLPVLFVGWEGVGLCSYLLIGFWYKSNENAKAANKAFIVNRIGDWGLTLGLFLILATIAMNLDRIGEEEMREIRSRARALKRNFDA